MAGSSDVATKEKHSRASGQAVTARSETKTVILSTATEWWWWRHESWRRVVTTIEVSAMTEDMKLDDAGWRLAGSWTHAHEEEDASTSRLGLKARGTALPRARRGAIDGLKRVGARGFAYPRAWQKSFNDGPTRESGSGGSWRFQPGSNLCLSRILMFLKGFLDFF